MNISNLSVLILCGVVGFPSQVYSEGYNRLMCGRNVTQILSSFRTTVTAPPTHCHLDVQKLMKSLTVAMYYTRSTLSSYCTTTHALQVFSSSAECIQSSTGTANSQDISSSDMTPETSFQLLSSRIKMVKTLQKLVGLQDFCRYTHSGEAINRLGTLAGKLEDARCKLNSCPIRLTDDLSLPTGTTLLDMAPVIAVKIAEITNTLQHIRNSF